MRILKFYQRGYRIPLESLGRVVSRLISGIDDFEVFVGLSEEERAKKITTLLREVDPEVNPDHFHR